MLRTGHVKLQPRVDSFWMSMALYEDTGFTTALH